jgi:nitrate reductase delta subunit
MPLYDTPPAAAGTLRVLARLLSYPDHETRANLGEMAAVLKNEGALTAPRLAELQALIDLIARTPPLEAEAEYVELFDRGRHTSLHLFEHVHGDSRDRGPAMVDLLKTYESGGLYLAPGELPDYLPAVLEFASTQPPRETRAFLAEMAHLLNSLFAALQKRHGAYASVLGALLELAGEKAQPVSIAAEEAVDASWAEPRVFDGASSHGQTGPAQPQPIHFVRNTSASEGVQA